jgi:cyanophycin synthetase
VKILEIRSFRGRNIFSHKPVIKMMLDLEDLANIPTIELTGFNEKLLKWFPGLKTHYCSLGHENGFVERLEEGTLTSHVTEHLTLELQCLMGYEVYYGKTRIFEQPSIYCLVFEYINEKCAIECARAAVEIISKLAQSKSVVIDEILNRLQRIAFSTNLGPSTQAIYDEARRRNIPVRRLGEGSLLQLGYGKNLRLIEASLIDTTSCIAVDLAKNKQITKEILKNNNIPTPEGYIVCFEDEAIEKAEQLGYPITVKPFDGNQGKGVTTNINCEKKLLSAYYLAKKYTDYIIVEKSIPGKDYRILVVGDKVCAAAERKPPFVMGDGIHSVAELVKQENNNPNRGDGHEKPLTRIKLDSVAQELLTSLGLSEEYIPGVGEIVYLRNNGNLSTGGSARECTLEVHPVNKALAVKAAKVIGLDVAGIDVVMDDISKPLTSRNGAVIEVNAAPGLRMHLYPTEGQPRNVAADILDYIYPRETPFSIPIISITGTNGKTTVTRMISHVLSVSGQKVGMTCSSGTFIGKQCIAQGDNTGPVSACSILYNKEIEIAVLETARGGIIRKGLGYDLADVGVITNISDDHLGLDGIDSLEDLAFTKALVVEAVKANGYAVLNADDRMTKQIMSRVRCNLIYFSKSRDNQIIEHQINQGGIAVVVENEQVILYRNKNKKTIAEVKDIPITFEGKAICNIENTIAAVAGLVAVGVPDHIIRLGLLSFQPDIESNAGRLNFFNMGNFQVLLDYGHNIKAYKSVIQFIRNMDVSRLVGVIGVPGDRLNKSIYEIGKISGQAFSKLYIKEDKDLRGRNSGEIANLLYQGALKGGARPTDIKIILSENQALKAAIQNALPGDLIVIFYESFESVYNIVKKYKIEEDHKANLFIPEEMPVSVFLQ